MFWNDPNLYSVAFRDLPNIPNPFMGTMPRYFNPYLVPPTYFPPQMTPQMFAPPVAPYMHTPPVAPFNYTLPYFQGYRPFGL